MEGLYKSMSPSEKYNPIKEFPCEVFEGTGIDY